MTYLTSDDMISCLPVYYAIFSFLLFLAFFSLILLENSKKVYNIQNNRLCFLADSLFTRIQPSLRDRFFISWKHNVLFSISPNPDGVIDQVRPLPACAATKAVYRLEISERCSF